MTHNISFVLRPICEDDLSELKQLASTIHSSLTSLPKNEAILESKIDDSLRSFDPRIKKPGEEHYFFVVEDVIKKRIVGTSGIVARVGGFDPFYSYQIKHEIIRHPPLGIEKEIEVLHLKLDYKGPSEICSLFVSEDYRQKNLGRLLSLSRFLFMVSFPRRFDTCVIAELRGYINDDGKSPFWESVGRHFFEQDFYTVDFLSGLGEKDFIRNLMPRYPIYVSLLSPEVQAVIGRVHRNSEPALRILKAEGFVPLEEIDIFDAGPLLSATLGNIRTVRESRQAVISDIVKKNAESPNYIVANCELNFRACFGSVVENADGTVNLSEELSEQLELSPGNTITYTPTHNPT